MKVRSFLQARKAALNALALIRDPTGVTVIQAIVEAHAGAYYPVSGDHLTIARAFAEGRIAYMEDFR